MTLGLLRMASGIALGDELAVFQHPDVLAHAHDHFHVVLDEQDGQVELVADMPDEAHEFGAFLRVHPGGGLVEEQEVRAGRQGAGDFKAPLRPVGQARRLFVHVGIEREAVDEALRLLADFLFLAPCAGQAEDGHPPLAFAADLTADHDVFQRGFAAEEPDVLEGPGPCPPCRSGAAGSPSRCGP